MMRIYNGNRRGEIASDSLYTSSGSISDLGNMCSSVGAFCNRQLAVSSPEVITRSPEDRLHDGPFAT